MMFMKAELNASKLYILKGRTQVDEAHLASCHHKSSSTWLWHLRLGHVSMKGLEALSRQNMLMGDKVEALGFCDDCVVGKTHKVKFNLNSTHRAKGILDYIHTDLWGPSRIDPYE